MMSIEEIYVWLSLIEEINYFVYLNLIRYFETVQNIYLCKSKNEYIMAGINNLVAEKLVDSSIKEKARNIYYNMIEDGVTIVTYDSYNYCSYLKNIYLPPFVYYIKGKNILNEDTAKILLTGTRNPSKYGNLVTKHLLRDLAKENIVLITTLDNGIDRICLEEALTHKIKICLVLLYSLDKVKIHKTIINKVLEYGGMILTEYPYDFLVPRKKFYLGARVLTGISDKLLVVESKERSKVNILVDFALEQGKDIYAVPGSIFSSTSLGTNSYINEGAKIICNIKDILE